MSRALYADLGKIDYFRTLEIQRALVSMRHDEKIQDIIVFAEHDPAVLVGRNISVHEDRVKELGLPVHKNMAHSGVVYIGPGQLFVYPIHDYTRLLKPHDAAGYNRLVENVMDSIAEVFGVPEGSRVHTKKLHLDHRVAYHGFQINVSRHSTKHKDVLNHKNNNSIEEATGYDPHMDTVKTAVLAAVKKHFGYDRIEQCEIVQNEDGIAVRKQ